MSADASLSSAQLAERLEKSEAGRKKLRQAISILQEKLAASEKLIKDNDTLQQECERERQRAESEKKKAEEERRLRVALEKDSATIKDQLAKVFQRLGAVENKQKADKKEVERLRNEVRLSVEGMHVASQAVDAVQSSFQSLENNLLEKVNGAFKEAQSACEAVHHLQSSFQSLEKSVIKKGSSSDNQIVLSATNPVSEKLVDEISRLFHREKQSHCKIEQRLSKLKSVLKQGRWDSSLTTAENFDVENPAFSKMDEEKTSKKRKLQGEKELLNHKARKRKKGYDVDVVNNAVNRSNADLPKEANEDQSMSSPFSIDYQMTSEEPGFVPHVPNTASNECIEEAVVNHTCSSNAKVHMQVPPVVVKAQKEIQESSFAHREKIDGGLDVNEVCLKNTCMQNGSIPETLKMVPHGSVDQLAGQEGIHGRGSGADVPCCLHVDDANEASDFDLSDNSDDEWWSQDRVLLSPSLPDIPSPLHHSLFSSMEPSPSRADAHTAGAVFGSNFNLNKVSMTDLDVPREAAIGRANTQGAGMQHGCKLIDVGNKQFNVNSQTSFAVLSPSLQMASCSRAGEQPNKVESITECQLVCTDDHTEVGANDAERKVQSADFDQAAVFNVSETSIGTVEFLTKETESSSFHESCHSLDPVSADKFGNENVVPSDKQENLQFDVVFGVETVDSAAITEIDNFLDVLPPIPSTFAIESCASDDVNQVLTKVGMSNYTDSMPCKIVANELDTSIQPQAACEMLMSKVIATKDSSTVNYSLHDGSDFQQVTNLSVVQCPPIQDYSHSFRTTYSVSESSNCVHPQAVLISSMKRSSSSVVFLLQAFDVHEVDAELNVIAACIMAINFKGYLQAISADKEEMQLQEASLSRTSANIPLEYLACSLISVAVDVVRLENGGKYCSSEAKPIFVLVQVLVAFIRSMFKENANIIIDTIFTQLGRFLIQGEAMLVTLNGSMTSCQDALSYATLFKDPKHHSHQFTEATLEDIHAGGKVLAALCQVLSCVTHLQNIVYEVLGWCDKDIMWLLTVFSSFSSICGKTAFMVEADDLFGHAICAIILELVASVEQDCTKSAEGTINKATKTSPCMSLSLPMGWAAMKEILEGMNGKMNVEKVVLAVFETLRNIFGSTHESVVLAFQPLVKNELSCTKECSDYNTRPQEGSDLSEEEAVKDSDLWKVLPHRKVDAARGLEDWKKKYGEAVGALQLIVQFMGWEWAYNHLIIRYLWREAVSGSAQLCVAVVSHILSLLWRMGVQGGGYDLPGLVELKKCLAQIVQSTSILKGEAEPILLVD